MGEGSKIQWTHHTFNPWWGCTRVSPGCERCYAETFSKRVGLKVWGPQAPRRFFGDKHWSEPLKWNRKAEQAGERHRVFCASMADVFEDRPELVEPRARLWSLIGDTPALDWLLLTKRPENVSRLANQAGMLAWDRGGPDRPTWLPNIWLGVTAEDQKRADDRISRLLTIRGPAVRFVSYEPALEAVSFFAFVKSPLRDASLAALGSAEMPGVDWIIVGGESGSGARPFDVRWAHEVVRLCQNHGVACFVKQLGSNPHESMRSIVGGWMPGDPEPDTRLRLRHGKGDDPTEWPEELRVREVPRPFEIVSTTEGV